MYSNSTIVDINAHDHIICVLNKTGNPPLKTGRRYKLILKNIQLP